MKKMFLFLAAVLMVVFVAAACGGDDDDAASGDSSGSSGEGQSVDEASEDDLKVWQTDLNAVGCYVGPVDGVSGPQTEAAIRAFQAAKGLTVDGLLGPQTEAALEESVAAGEIVCTSGESGGEIAGPVATLESSSYGPKDFAIGSCSLNADVSNMSVRAEADNITLEADATEGTGTVAVSGGTESDGIELNGDITEVSIDGRSFTATGEFTEPNNAGEEFELTGDCTDL